MKPKLSAWQRLLVGHELEKNPDARIAYVSVGEGMSRQVHGAAQRWRQRAAPYHAAVNPDGTLIFQGAKVGTYYITFDDIVRPPPRVDFRVSPDTLLALAGRAELAPPSARVFDAIADSIRARADHSPPTAPAIVDEAARREIVDRLYRETIFDRSVIAAAVDTHSGDERAVLAELAARAAFHRW